jgi:hypothetical protein
VSHVEAHFEQTDRDMERRPPRVVADRVAGFAVGIGGRPRRDDDVLVEKLAGLVEVVGFRRAR